MMQLDSVIVQKPREEIRARKTQSPFKIRSKRNDFACIFIWTIMAQGRTPLDHRSRVQKSLFHKGFQIRLTALTWQPPFFTGGLGLHLLPLRRLLEHHAECHWTLLAHTMTTLTKNQGRRRHKKESRSESRSTERARIDLNLRRRRRMAASVVKTLIYRTLK